MREAMRGFLKQSGLEQRLRDWPVFDAWTEALGEKLARRARPVAFRAGELQVEVESAAHLHELQGFTGDQYRQLANKRLGREEIRRVVFRLER